MRILKCQTCRNTWIYTGDLPDSCICSLCRTTVRLGRAQIPIRWDAAPDDPLLENTAIPYIDVYDRLIDLAFLVASDDGRHARTLIVSPRVMSEIGISAQELVDAVTAAGGSVTQSGRYPITPAIRDRIQPIFEGHPC